MDARCVRPLRYFHFVTAGAAKPRAMRGKPVRDHRVRTRALFVPIESERRPYFLILTRFLYANRYPLRLENALGSSNHRAVTRITPRCAHRTCLGTAEARADLLRLVVRRDADCLVVVGRIELRAIAAPGGGL